MRKLSIIAALLLAGIGTYESGLTLHHGAPNLKLFSGAASRRVMIRPVMRRMHAQVIA